MRSAAHVAPIVRILGVKRRSAVAASCCAAVFLALASGSAFSSDHVAAKEGVAVVRFSPKPFYDDLTRMNVRFVTTGRARPGFEYFVSLQALGPAALPLNCTTVVVSSESDRGHIVGAPGRGYTAVLRTYEPITGTRYFCKGPAVIWVGAASIRNASRKTTRIYRKVSLRILPAP